MSDKILFVDDEPQILQAMERQLRNRFNLRTANSGAEALAILQAEGPFAVIVSDMRMPTMDGVQLLSRVKDQFPDTVRMMLTGNADQDTAVEAVNKGQIFRFLNKPCPLALMAPALALALRQYRLVTVERDLLDQTLKGSINVLAELLSLANPAAFSSGYRIKTMVGQLAAKLALPNQWQYEIAALMSQVGCVILPSEILHKVHAGVPLELDEEQTYKQHPAVGARLVRQIPRLEAVADMIEHQLLRWDEYPPDSTLDEDLRTGAQILKLTFDYDLAQHQGLEQREALRLLHRNASAYKPGLLDLLVAIQPELETMRVLSLRFQDISPGMIANEDIFARNGALIIPKDQIITWPIIQGMKNFAKHIGLNEPISVRVLDA
ncbi:MAG: two-component system response regulator [Desulfobulbaceae bacterium A2]|nr:MAG: two-component system response regulator [Desulfobulbaceae bacterium A2]